MKWKDLWRLTAEKELMSMLSTALADQVWRMCGLKLSNHFQVSSVCIALDLLWEVVSSNLGWTTGEIMLAVWRKSVQFR